MGSGRTEIMRSLFGLDTLDRGEIHVRGKKVSIRKPKSISFLPDINPFDVKLNRFVSTMFSRMEKSSTKPKGFISGKKEMDFVNTLIKRLQIKTQSAEATVGSYKSF
jgi:ribose transport system ATP-binding protein